LTLAGLGPFLLFWHQNSDATFVELMEYGWDLLLGVPILWVFYFLVNRYVVNWQVKNMLREGNNRGSLGKIRVQLSPAGVLEASQFIETKIAWPAIERIEENDDYLMIYTSSLSAVLIPRIAFANPLRYDEFATAARAFYKQNQSS
jgi:hypothetical protein